MDDLFSAAEGKGAPKTPAEICRAVNADFKLQGLTHAEAAERLGIERRAVSNQLSGKRPFAKKGALLYARVFGYDEAFLLFGTGELRKHGERGRSLVDDLLFRLGGKDKARLFEEFQEILSQMEDLQSKLEEAQEANRQMEQEIQQKEGEIARLCSVKVSAYHSRERFRKRGIVNTRIGFPIESK